MKKLLSYILPLVLLLLLIPSRAEATILPVGGFGTVANETSSTTAVIAATNTLEAGNVGLLSIAFDNTATTDGDFSEVTSVVDSSSNTWTKLKEQTNGNAAAAAGCTISLWYTRATTDLPITTGTITITFSNTVVAKAATTHEFTVGGALTLAGSTSNTSDVSNGFGSLTISGLTASTEYLYWRAGAKESGTTTALTVTTNYTIGGGGALRSGANSAASMAVRSEFRIATATTETSNPTMVVSADNASVFVALSESGAPAPLNSGFFQFFPLL